MAPLMASSMASTLDLLINILSAKLGGYVQNASTVIKLLPLIFIAVAGLFLGKPSAIEFNNITNMTSFG